MDLCKWIQRLHFTHLPSPHITPSAFPHQPERQAYEQMREELFHNGRFTTLFCKALPRCLSLKILFFQNRYRYQFDS